jgi:hypothetical protein
VQFSRNIALLLLFVYPSVVRRSPSSFVSATFFMVTCPISFVKHVFMARMIFCVCLAVMNVAQQDVIYHVAAFRSMPVVLMNATYFGIQGHFTQKYACYRRISFDINSMG